SLLLMGGVVAAVGLGRRLARRRLRSRPRLLAFLLEMLGTFQVCACTGELSLLGGAEPWPHTALTLTYGLAVLHGLTLPGSACNPCACLRAGGALGVAAQFAAAALARLSLRLVWSLELAEPHAGARSQRCSTPMQTTELQAFCIELLFSVVFQLAVLRAESVAPKYRVHLLALLITMLVYAGGNLTGAIFNPALAFSLHADCFYDKFLSYSLVYWIAPALGKFLILYVF
ncbi:AQP11 protein, partial [Scytalopus superciliaris]|nr:AQP11 protein [Scytalopus superciliaris]